MKLPPRLAAVASLAVPCRTLADIGTDHALLPVSLIRSGRCERAFACDVNEGPLARAAAAVKQSGFDDRIRLIRSDGLADVPEEYDTAVFAGMGGDLISELLRNHPPRPGVRLVFQPMTKPETLRRFLSRHGYRILRERAAAEGEKRYIVLSALREPGPELSAEDCCLPQNLDCTGDALLYLEKLLCAHQKRLQGLLRAEEPDDGAVAFERRMTHKLEEYWQEYSRRLYDETHGCGGAD